MSSSEFNLGKEIRSIAGIIIAGYLASWVLALFLDVDPRYIRIVTFLVVAVIAGIFRAGAYHPCLNVLYGAWLANTPWRSERDLPVGRIRISLTDLYLVISLAVLSTLNGLPWGWRFVFNHFALIAVFFLLGYLPVLAGALALGRRPVTVVLLAFALPLTLYPVASIWMAFAVLFSVYLIAANEQRSFMRSFPWKTDYWDYNIRDRLKFMDLRLNVVGWPYKELRSDFGWPEIKYRYVILAVALWVWWTHVFIAIALEEKYCKEVVLFMVSIVAVVRLVAFVGSCRPPISIWGRLATRRYIIPGYDRVFIAPLLAISIACMLPRLLISLHVVEWAASEISVAVALLTLFACKPTLWEWQLTSHHRKVPQQANRHKLGPLTIEK